MSKHTPGPWTYEYNNDCGPFCEWYEMPGVFKAEREEDARLISMSPQILLALIDAADIFRGLADAVPILKERSEAYDHLIAKARGDYE